MIDHWKPPELSPDALDYWQEIYSQLEELDLLEQVQPIYARLAAQALLQYDLITMDLNQRVTQVDELPMGDAIIRQVAPEVRVQAELIKQIRGLLKDLLLHDRQPDSDPDPIAAIRFRVNSRRVAERAKAAHEPSP